MSQSDSPIRRRTEDERAAYIQGLRAGVEATLSMIATAYGEDVAERLKPEALGYVDLVAGIDP